MASDHEVEMATDKDLERGVDMEKKTDSDIENVRLLPTFRTAIDS